MQAVHCTQSFPQTGFPASMRMLPVGQTWAHKPQERLASPLVQALRVAAGLDPAHDFRNPAGSPGKLFPGQFRAVEAESLHQDVGIGHGHRETSALPEPGLGKAAGHEMVGIAASIAASADRKDFLIPVSGQFEPGHEPSGQQEISGYIRYNFLLFNTLHKSSEITVQALTPPDNGKEDRRASKGRRTRTERRVCSRQKKGCGTA